MRWSGIIHNRNGKRSGICVFPAILIHPLQTAVLLFFTTGMIFCSAFAQSPHPIDNAENGVITLHGGDWDSFKLINAIGSYILRNGYGYTPIIIPGPEKMVGESLSAGDVDISLEVWKENHPPELQQFIDNGTIVDYGKIYDRAAHVFIIPEHFAEQYNISSLKDMQQYWYLCKDPEDPSKGLFYNALISWLVHDTNLRKLDAYGLSPYYNPVSMPSGRSYEAVFRKAARENRLVFGLYWIPSSLMGTGYWRELREPDNPDCTNGSLQSGVAGGTNQPPLCPYQNSEVHKLVSQKLLTRAPEVIPFLTALKPDEEAISRTLEFGFQNNISDWDRLAGEYLINNRERWKTWVSTDAGDRVEKALAINATESG